MTTGEWMLQIAPHAISALALLIAIVSIRWSYKYGELSKYNDLQRTKVREFEQVMAELCAMLIELAHAHWKTEHASDGEVWRQITARTPEFIRLRTRIGFALDSKAPIDRRIASLLSELEDYFLECTEALPFPDDPAASLRMRADDLMDLCGQRGRHAYRLLHPSPATKPIKTALQGKIKRRL
jgi:hypothetical protein